jgi:hypothetical protein
MCGLAQEKSHRLRVALPDRHLIPEPGLTLVASQALYLPTMKNDHGVDRIYIGGNARAATGRNPT